jgi:cation transport regulator
LPYAANEDLPANLRRKLPPDAQDIFREAFNHAWESHRGDPDLEGTAHRIAWAAVKRRYRKSGEVWVPKDEQA